MPKINVYLPDDLFSQVRERDDLPVSSICQDALRTALTGRDVNRQKLDQVKVDLLAAQEGLDRIRDVVLR